MFCFNVLLAKLMSLVSIFLELGGYTRDAVTSVESTSALHANFFLIHIHHSGHTDRMSLCVCVFV